ncbi:hypothetical protein [Aureimonas sp. AU4]|uniref:hypothetical protein n=1 Tax=Aureimonas sp. AU4 TaxID=1638163 RepID=UPI000782B8A7|nr:hypothetical protein [Aureimonas sp. AU4]
MDHRTRADLLLMTLELRLALRAPSELVGQRLTSQRLQEIAAALEERLSESGLQGESGQAYPANDRTSISGARTAVGLRGRS